MKPWRIHVDTGGTFTDAVAEAPDGTVREVKVLSSSALRGRVIEVLAPDVLRVELGPGLAVDLPRGFEVRFPGTSPMATAPRVTSFDPSDGRLTLDAPLAPPPPPGALVDLVCPEEAPLLAARVATGTPGGAPLPPLEMRLATTRGTNALLERRGARVALVTTEGFADVLDIGDQRRPDLFARHVVKPPPLHAHSAEVQGRRDADGAVVTPIDVEGSRALGRRLASLGFADAAVALVHSWRDPSDEDAVAAALREGGVARVVASARTEPMEGFLDRATTAVVEATLRPDLSDYLRRTAAALPRGALRLLTSAGSLVAAESFRAVDGLLSGPAGGVLGAAAAGRRAGFARVLAFDMGGTSTDTSRWAGAAELEFEQRVGDVRLLAPALAVETVAAGGGSICRAESGRLRVGPESAGAVPGPACYGAGGPLTLTDCNLLLGRLDADAFAVPLNRDAAETAFRSVRDALEAQGGGRPDAAALLEGFLAIADERMAEAIRVVSVRRGHDPSDHALVAFGGAGGQHACAVAERLGIRAVVLPPRGGVLSAEGLRVAVAERFAAEQVLRPLEEVRGSLETRFGALASSARAALAEEGVPAEDCAPARRLAGLRFAGQDAVLSVPLEPGDDPAAAFRRRYDEVFGHLPGERFVELAWLRVSVAGRETPPPVAHLPSAREVPPTGVKFARLDGVDGAVPRYDRAALPAGARFTGPALVFERFGAAVLPRHWRAEVLDDGTLVLRREATADPGARDGFDSTAKGAPTSPLPMTTHPGAVERALFTGRFHAIAVEMGERLRRTAVSVNVKERLDFSCALLDPAGRLVVNAPHVPVHLGSLGLCVREVVRRLAPGPGDVVVTNHPACGGSHLPDVTVLAPVHADDGTLLGYVASRAHHAELGGSRPGSMPPDARTLAEEGVVLPPILLFEAGIPRWERVEERLLGGPWPTRRIEDNLADLRAAVAAVRHGADALRMLANIHGSATLLHQMDELRGEAARLLGEALAARGDGDHRAEEFLDDGTPLRVRIVIRGSRARIDFEGSGPVHPGNLNATPAVVRSAVLYVLRLLLDRPLPLNEGLLEPVDLHIPEGILSPPFPDDPEHCPAVVGGNTETSQRVVDTLLKALSVAAASQGTMNNVVFGDSTYGYYETVGGGCGGGPGGDGASGVHSHMTNTRITDVEVLERRCPVRVERFALRRGSGGDGHRRGGDGLIREIRFLRAASLSLVGQRRLDGPYGMQGGLAGAPARQCLLRSDGMEEILPSSAAADLHPGDRLLLETPGGGGWGALDPRQAANRAPPAASGGRPGDSATAHYQQGPRSR